MSNKDEDDDQDSREDLSGAAKVQCPYCGELVEITLDPGGGGLQQYVEDCAVCCQPWNVSVRIARDGSSSVTVAGLNE